jgi:hypothetical protein
MPDLEGVGDAVTGGIAARAVEPGAGEADDGRTREANCLNCGARLAGDYCHACGQRAHVHRTLGAFWHDVAHSVVHFDGKVWRTLPLLAWKPGELTRRYIHGERARFVSPIALFLFSVFLMFAVFSLIGGPVGSDAEPGGSLRSQREALADQQSEVRELEAERERLRAAGRPTDPVDAQIAARKTAIELGQRIVDEAGGKTQPSAQRTESGDKARITFTPTGIGPIDAGIAKAQENPELLGYKLQNNAYKFSWALIPISTPFVWLLFLHRRRYRRFGAYDHAVFVTYSIAFMSLALIGFSLLRAIGVPEDPIVLAMLAIAPVHIYRQLRSAYELGRRSALWRTAALIAFAAIVTMLFLVLLLALGLF